MGSIIKKLFFFLLLSIFSFCSLTAQNQNKPSLPRSSFYTRAELIDAIEGLGQIGFSATWSKPSNRAKSVSGKIISLDTLAAAGYLGGGSGGENNDNQPPSLCFVAGYTFQTTLTKDGFSCGSYDAYFTAANSTGNLVTVSTTGITSNGYSGTFYTNTTIEFTAPGDSFGNGFSLIYAYDSGGSSSSNTGMIITSGYYRYYVLPNAMLFIKISV